jgi:hypothetical protein
MRSWLKLTVIRAAVSLAVLLIVILLTIWLPGRSARSLIKDQLSQKDAAASKLNEATDLLDSLPVLNQVKTQQIGSIKAYADQAQKSADKFDMLDLKSPQEIKSLLGAGQIVRDTNNAIKDPKSRSSYNIANNDINMADKVFDYHAAVSQALVNVLEYNPVEDTKNFNLKSDDTKLRLEIARKGLLKTDDRLQKAKKIYKDPTIDEVTALVTRLRYGRYQLSQDGDVNTWTSLVNESQSRIVINRTKFWTSESTRLKQKLNADNVRLLNNQAVWKELAVKYGIH